MSITRERLLEIIVTGPEASGAEQNELARMALAAMDGEPVAVIDPANLDYLRSGADADVWPPDREEMGDVLLYRHAQQPVVPEGYKLVPTELTSEMVKAFRSICEAYDDDLIAGYKAMLAAAPQPVKGGE
ncbi:hypothetical protein [Klebsiella pneumoniae]|uniref:hypothetical protein n=1 Tax=Klebsiella pneumoniae TaxID=573 RepID=UPI0040457D56